mgnify:CR=1 FL=1
MKKTLLTMALLMTSSMAWAGGYQLQEYSITNLGRSFAGAGMVGDDYSAIAFNPAGMQLNGTGLQLGATYAHIRATTKGSLTGASGTTYGVGELHANKLIPHFFGQKKINDRLTLGGGVYVPFGLGTYYNNKNWFGASHAINSEITTQDFAVAGAYKLTDKLTIGASFFLEYLEARLTSTANDMNAHDNTTPGYNVGLMYQPAANTRLGITYRSKTIHQIKGPHYLGTFYGDCGTKLIMPEHVLMSAYHKMDKWGFSAMARWTRWSRFSKLNIWSDAMSRRTSGAMRYAPEVDEDWKNVWMISGGLDYDVNNNWTVRTGLAWDEGAVKRSRTRTARVPDTNRWIASVGASYKAGPWQWDAGYSRVFMRRGLVSNPLNGTTLNAKYRMGIDLVGVSMQYTF